MWVYLNWFGWQQLMTSVLTEWNLHHLTIIIWARTKRKIIGNYFSNSELELHWIRSFLHMSCLKISLHIYWKNLNGKWIAGRARETAFLPTIDSKCLQLLKPPIFQIHKLLNEIEKFVSLFKRIESFICRCKKSFDDTELSFSEIFYQINWKHNLALPQKFAQLLYFTHASTYTKYDCILDIY